MGTQGLTSRAIIGTFYNRLNQNTGAKWVADVSNYFTSDQESETYRWIGQIPSMREWIGGRKAKGFTVNGLTINNKHFESTIEISTDDLRRDKTNQISVRIKELADRTNSHWAQILSKLILSGESTPCYDGQYFFDHSHKEGDSGVQSNIISYETKDGKTITVDEFRDALLKGIGQILSLKDNQGEPMNENASRFVVMVPTCYWHIAKSAISVPLSYGGGTNPIKVMDDMDIYVVQNPRLTWTDQFVIFRTDAVTKPFIRQEEKEVVLKVIAEGSELEYKENKHSYGVDSWRNVGYGFWQYACLVKINDQE